MSKGETHIHNTSEEKNEEKHKEEIEKIILKKYMEKVEVEIKESQSVMSEKSFDNLDDEAYSPRADSPLLNSKKLQRMEWELSMPRTRLSNFGRIFFALNCIFCVKCFFTLPMELLHNGGWFFLIPLIFCTFVFAIPMVLLEISLGQYTSQLSTVIFSRISPIATGVGIMLPILRVLIFLYYRIEHRNISLIWDMIHKVFFTNRNVVCWRQNGTDCYIPNACLEDGDVFYQGGCYDREELWKESKITTQMMIRLSAMELLQRNHFYGDQFIAPIPHVDRIFNADANAHKLDAVIGFFFFVFLFSKMGVSKFSKIIPWLHGLIGGIFLILFFALFSQEIFQEACADYFRLIAHRSDSLSLLKLETWRSALVDTLTMFAIGDGTLHALGAINIFNNNIIWDVFIVLCSWFALSTFSILFFGTIILAGIKTEQRESDALFNENNIAQFLKKVDMFPYHESIMNPLYYFSWINSYIQYCSFFLFIVLFLLYIAPHVLMAENMLAVWMRCFNRFSQLNKDVFRHCILFVYYVLMALVYCNVTFGFAEKSFIGAWFCYIVLAVVFWECLVIHRLYGIDRFLVNVRTMIDKSSRAYDHIKRLSRILFHLWSWFIPGIAGLLFLTAMISLLREINISLLIMGILLVSFMPLYVASWLITKKSLEKVQMHVLFRPTIDWGPFGVIDKINANFDEKAARLFY